MKSRDPAVPIPDMEMLRLYWHAQWERVAKLEENRLHLSNFVVAASIVSMGLTIATERSFAWIVALVGGAVVLSNLTAIWYCDRTERSIRMHLARSDVLLQEYWPYLYDLKVRVGPAGPMTSAERVLWRGMLAGLTRPRVGFTVILQQVLHLILAGTSVGLVIVTVMRS